MIGKINKIPWMIISLQTNGDIIVYFKNGSFSTKTFQDFNAVKNFIVKNNLRCNNIVLALNDDDCIIKLLKLPAESNAEAVKMLDFEIDSILPVNREKIEYAALPRKLDDKLVQLRVFVTFKEKLEGILDNFADMNIQINRIIPAISCIDIEKMLDLNDWSSLSKIINDPLFSQLNLLPTEHKKRLQKKDFTKKIFLLFVLAFSMIVSSLVFSKSIDSRFLKEKDIYLKQIDPVRHIAKTVESKKTLIKALHSQAETRGKMTEILAEIYKITPRSVSISNMQIIKDQSKLALNLNGRAKLLSDAFSYTEVCKDSKLLKKLNLDHVQQIPTPNGKSVVEFSANCIIEEK